MSSASMVTANVAHTSDGSNLTDAAREFSNHPDTDHLIKIRRVAQGKDPSVLTDIYREDINVVVWQRELSATLNASINSFVSENPNFQASLTVSPQSVSASMSDYLDDSAMHELRDNISELVDMFCYLFELKRVGLRLTALDRAMCPKFHVDRVPCRLITTYQGSATEWLPHHAVNRSKLGLGSNGMPDDKSGLYNHAHDIQQVSAGDVALLKGELWEGNENAGLVHRSPALANGDRRLLLTLDFSQ